jgi:hypothetical protein
LKREKFFDRKMLAGIFSVVLLSTAITLTGPGESLDAKFYYDGEQARAFLGSLDALKAQQYFRQEILDLFFIVAYTSVIFMALRKRLPKMAWLAFPGAAFDFVETSAILYALSAAPVGLDQLGYVTALKWIFFTAAKLTVLYGLLLARRKRQKSMS